jgi:uncharacterized protein (TIGR03437 family)
MIIFSRVGLDARIMLTTVMARIILKAFLISTWLLYSPLAKSQTTTEEWVFRGPQPTGPPTQATSGRVTALAVDPRHSDTIFLGAANGGIWKSIDGGFFWLPLTDNQPSMAIGSIAIAPSNPDTIYVGTGEANACELCSEGFGILKTSDSGVSWQLLPGPFVDHTGRGARIGSIAVDPANSSVILAAAYFIEAAGLPGLYRSTDGGEHWTPVLNLQQGTDVVFADTDVAYAALYGMGVYKSTDGGRSWVSVNGVDENVLPIENAARIDLALSAVSPQTVYAAITDGAGDGLKGLFKTVDGGQNWSRLSQAPDYCRPNCTYHNELGVDPANPETVFAGGVHLHRSLDGGSSWDIVSRGSSTVIVPPRHHAIAFATSSSSFVAGTDSGVYRGADRAALSIQWSNLNSNLGIAQFHAGLSVHPGNASTLFGGTAGNGIQRFFSGLRWEKVGCEIGGRTLQDPRQPAVVYASCGRTDIQKSTDGGTSWTGTTKGINLNDRTETIPPLIFDPSNPSRLYFGTFRLYQSADSGGSWVSMSPDLGEGVSTLTAIAVAPSDPRVVYAGNRHGRVSVSLNVSAGQPAFWENRSSGLPSRKVTQLATDPADSFIAYASVAGFSGRDDTRGHVFRTSNLGLIWQDISGDLPNLAVNDLLVDFDIPGTLYAATDVAVFRTTNHGQNWLPLATGLPRAPVLGLTLHRASRTLLTATHGRGVWQLPVPLPEGLNSVPGLSTVLPSTTRPSSVPLTVTLLGTGFLPGALVHWNGQPRATSVISNRELRAVLEADDLAAPTLGIVSVLNPAPGGGESNFLNFTVASEPLPSAQGTVNGASYAAPVAAGSIASVFGINLSLSNMPATAVPLPGTLSGAVVRVAGRTAPLFAVSPQQINFQVPWELEGQDSATIEVQVGAVTGSRQSVQLAEYSPGIFTLNQAGTGQASVLIGNSTLFAAPLGFLPNARPVRRGEVISIFCTGLGRVSNPPATGAPAAQEPLSITLTSPMVFIGGQQAGSVFAALAPGLVGLYQVNVRIPEEALTGDAVPLSLTIGGVASNTVTIAIE